MQNNEEQYNRAIYTALRIGFIASSVMFIDSDTINEK